MNHEIDYKSLDVEVLEEEFDKVDTDLIMVKQQIDKVEAEYKELNIPADADWYSRAKTARRILAKKRQKLCKLISDVKKKQNSEYHERYERYFIEVAKRRISEELYQEIKDEVQFMIDNPKEQ